MTYFDEATETLPRPQLAALQLRKLQVMMTHLWGKNQFYTDKWQAAGVQPEDIASLADLERLPLTRKDELMEDQAAHGPFGSNLTYPLRPTCACTRPPAPRGCP